MAVFSIGGEVYLYDQGFGAHRVWGACHGMSLDLIALHAQLTIERVINGYATSLAGASPRRLVERIPVRGDVFRTVQGKLSRKRSSAVIAYAGQQLIAFTDRGRICVYDKRFGTVVGVLKKPRPALALRVILASIYGGNGIYKELAGIVPAR